MGMHDFISEHEACLITAMTPRTLQRFAEAGYLAVEIEHDGLRLYSKRQLASVFGGPVAKALGEEVPPLVEVQAPVLEEGLPQTNLEAEIASIFTGEEPAHTARIEPEERIAEAAPSHNQAAKPVVDSGPELSRLQNLLEMQEKILDGKDSEIGELRRERDWLRARIERLEEKSNRDQLLLLSETQTIRRLIVMSENKKSTFRQMLEWCGLAKEESGSNHDVVVDMAPAVMESKSTEAKRAGNS